MQLKKNLNKIKGFIFRSLLEKNPRLLKVARYVQFMFWRLGVKYRMWRGAEHQAADEIIWVDPQIITGYIGDLPWSRYEMRGLVVDGDWDLAVVPFRGWDVFKAIQARFTEGKAWKETDFYERVRAEIEQGHVKWGCSSIEEFDARLHRLELLYDEISTNGYKSQQELATRGEDRFAWESGTPFQHYDEVTVCIDRHGQVILRDGKHRLAISKVLGLKQIPVTVGVRHQQWQNFREELLDWVKSRGGKSYQPLTHPDLQNIPVQHDDGRFELMIKYLSTEHQLMQGGTLLDIGSFFGYFCHRFEEKGYDCTAVEVHPKHVYFMKALHKAENRKFEIKETSIFDEGEVAKYAYDIVLALSIFHHFLKTPSSLESLHNLLGRLDARLMFFEPHCPDDYVMRNAHMNFEPQEFVNFVLENSCFTQARRLGNVSRGRSLYVLER